MTLRYYLKNNFASDLYKLDFEKPNSIEQEHHFGDDYSNVFFGGVNWTKCKTDLQKINQANIAYYIYGLFIMVSTDLTMYKYFNQHYHIFRSLTKYPKYGNVGFGYNLGKPKEFFMVPLKHEIIQEEQLKLLSEEAITFYFEEADAFFKSFLPNIPVNIFFSKLLSNEWMRVIKKDKGSFYDYFYDKMLNYLEKY